MVTRVGVISGGGSGVGVGVGVGVGEAVGVGVAVGFLYILSKLSALWVNELTMSNPTPRRTRAAIEANMIFRVRDDMDISS
jgi:hypothetical protein